MSARWHMLLPKPSGTKRRPALAYVTERLAPHDRLALQEIVAKADLLEVEGRTYIVAEISVDTCDTLSAFEAEGADLEIDDGADNDDDREPDHEDEATGFGYDEGQPSDQAAKPMPGFGIAR